MEKIQKYLPAPMVLLAFLLSFITIYATGSPLLQDFDMGWHIAAGDLIRTSGDIAPRDPWSFSGSQQIWYNISWLWDIVLSFVHEKTGVEGLFVFAATLPALVVALLIASLRARGNIGNNALIFIGMITTYCMLEFSTGRPQIVGILFALIFHHILHKTRNNPKLWQVFLLPLITVLWVNIHGSFFAGFIIIGAYGLEAIYSKNKQWFLRLFLVGILCVIATLINPYGINIITAVERTLNSVVTSYVSEWRPFVFGSVMGVSIWLLVFIMFSDLRNPRAEIADKILAIGWLIVMLFSVRNVGFLAVLGAPYMAFNFPADNEKDSNTRKLAAWINDKKFSPIILVLIPLVLVVSYFLLPVLGATHYIEKKEKAILPAINYVMQNYADKRIINDYDFGGRIIYESKGKLPVFMDGRAPTVYDEKILSDFLDFTTMKKDWQKILEQYKIDVIFISNNRDFAKDYAKGLYHDKWQEVFRDDVASVYVRKN